MHLDAHYQGPDFRRKEFDLGGTSFSLTKVFLTEKQRQKKHDEGWWFHLDLPIARIDLIDGTKVHASAGFTMRDIRPVVALLREEGQAPGWFRFLPNIKDIAGHAVVDMAPGAVEIQRLDLTGKGTVIKAHMDLKEEKEWAFFVKYKLFTVGIAFHDGQKSWKMKHARQWYDEQLAAMEAEGDEGASSPETGEAPE